MKKSILMIVLLAVAFTMRAQQPWTLQQCIDYAMEHNVGILQSRLQQQNADYQLKMSQNAWLPSVNASASEGLGFGQSPSYTGVYVSDNSSSASVGVSVSMPLFQGLNLYNTNKANELNLQASTQDLEAAKRDLRLAIMAYYMEVVYCKELLGVAEKQLELSESQHQRTQELFEVGRLPESNVYESAAQVATDRASLTEAQNNLMLRLLDITQALELDDVEGFDVVDPEVFMTDDEMPLVSPQATIQHALNHQPEMQAAQLRLQKAHYDLKAAKSAWYPSLSFYGGYSNGIYHYFTDGYANTPIQQQLQTNGRTQLGLSLNIPIFNGMQTKYRVKMTELGIENQQVNIENTSKKLKKEIQQAYYSAVAAKQKYVAADNSLKSSQLAYDYAQAGFEAGKTTLMELNESKNRLYKAESSLLQAKYEYLYRCKVMAFYNED
ncbi:MAG: TolC family protein [Bacteroidales bacterium]|nr:TolC family protein [Bacteroidales bacterium]